MVRLELNVIVVLSCFFNLILIFCKSVFLLKSACSVKLFINIFNKYLCNCYSSSCVEEDRKLVLSPIRRSECVEGWYCRHYRENSIIHRVWRSRELKARYRNQANFIGGLKNEVRLLQKKFEECSDTTSRLLSKQGKFIERMSLVIDAIGDSEEVIYFIIFSFTLYSTLIILYCCRFLSRSRYGGCPSKSLIWRQILTMVKWMMIWQMEWLEWRNLYVKVKWQIEILL